MNRETLRTLVPLLLSLNAGYVDTAGFLALQGLFTAHVTGNFVTFGAALVMGSSGILAKLLALPVFCAVVIPRDYSARGCRNPCVRSEILLGLKVVLLIVGAALAIHFGPFPNGDPGRPCSPAWCWWRRWPSRTPSTASISAARRLRR